MYDELTQTELLALQEPSGCTACAFSPDGTRIVTLGAGTARLWDSRPFRETRPPDPVRALAPPPRLAVR